MGGCHHWLCGDAHDCKTKASLNADEITITAGIQGDSSQSSTQSKSASTSVSVKASGDSYSGSLSANRSDSSSESQTRINSLIQAGNLTSDSDKLTIAGAQVDIDQDVTINTGELTLASLQDTSTSSSESSGMNAGLGLGGESLASLSSVGGNANSSHSDRAWVREQTRLIGGGNVTITADKTEIKGAVLASATVDEQGQLTDQGNLTLITDELLVSDIQDRDKSESEGFNLNTGLSSTGSSTLGLTANGHIKEQTTYATLGNGTIQTRTGDDHDLSHTNRDLNATQEITKDQQTRGLDSSVTVDHRVATENGRKAIQKDFVDSAQHAKEIAQSIDDVANTDLSGTGFFSQVNKYAIDRTVLAQKAADEKAQKKLRGDEGAEGSEEALQSLSDELSNAQGLEEGMDVALYDGSQIDDSYVAIDKTAVNKTDVEGAYHEKGSTAYLNIDKTNMTDSTSTVTTLVHEQARHEFAQTVANGQLSRDDQTTLAANRGSRAADVWEAYSDLAGISTTGSTSQTQWNNANRTKANIQTGTRQIASIRNNDLKARQLNLGEASKMDLAREKIKKSNLSDADKFKELRKLSALACAKVECAAGVSEDDPNYLDLKALQTEGETLQSEENTDILASLKSIGISTTVTKKTEVKNYFFGTTRIVESEEETFSYGLADHANDFIDSREDIAGKVDGAIQATAGTATTISGGALTASGTAGCGPSAGLTCLAIPVGVWLTSVGISETNDGVQKLTEPHVYQSGQRVIDSFSTATHQGEHSAVSELAKTTGIAAIEAVGSKIAVGHAKNIYDEIITGVKPTKTLKNGSEVADSEFSSPDRNVIPQAEVDRIDGTVDLYRAVAPEEFDDIVKTEALNLGPSGFGKQFGYSLDEILNLSDHLNDTAAIMKVKVPKSVLKELDHTPVDRHILRSGSLTVQPEKLDEFNKKVQSIEHIF